MTAALLQQQDAEYAAALQADEEAERADATQSALLQVTSELGTLQDAYEALLQRFIDEHAATQEEYEAEFAEDEDEDEFAEDEDEAEFAGYEEYAEYAEYDEYDEDDEDDEDDEEAASGRLVEPASLVDASLDAQLAGGDDPREVGSQRRSWTPTAPSTALSTGASPSAAEPPRSPAAAPRPRSERSAHTGSTQ